MHPLPKAPSDYDDFSCVLNFFSNTIGFDLPISIINDDLVETDEVFSASLSLVNPTADTRVQLQPNSAKVTIINDDSKCIIIFTLLLIN